MSVKTRIIIAVLLLFIPVIMGVTHRIYYHGKDSLTFTWKHKNRCKNYNKSEITPKEPIQEVPIQEIQSSDLKKDIKNAPAYFVGGEEALQRYIRNEVIYPENQTIKGSVFVKMRIDEQGYPTDIVVTKGMGNIFDKEAVRVVENMPLWEPQIKNYKVVKSDPIILEIPFERPIKSTNK